MAVGQADDSSAVQPRSLDAIANLTLTAASVHDDITHGSLKSFEHRHLADDTGRQAAELRKMCRRRPEGFFLHELASLAQLLEHVSERLEWLGGDSGELGTAAAALLLLCTRPFQKRLNSDEPRFGADAAPLFEALAIFLSTPASSVFIAAADALEAISLRFAALRPDAAAPMKVPMPPLIAALDACGAAERAMRAMHAEPSSARQQRLCDLLCSM